MEPIDKALAFLWQNSRFVSYFYQTVRFISDPELSTLTLTVQGKRAVLFYNPVFIESLSVEELVGLLVHEALHVVFNHKHRMFRDQNPFLQNLAQDMVINRYMQDRKDRFFSPKNDTRREPPRLVLPPGLPLIPRAFFEETGRQDPGWEEVYQWLKIRGPKELQDFNQGLKSLFSKEHASAPPGHEAEASENGNTEYPEQEAKAGKDPGDVFVLSTPDNQPLPTGVHSLAPDEAHRILESNLLKAVQLSQRDDSALADRLFGEISTLITRPRSVVMGPVLRKVKTVVHRFSQSRDWQPAPDRFNRRFFAQGIYTPGRSYVNRKTLTVAVDVSASMVTRPETLEKAFGVVEALIKTYRVSLVCLDENLFVPVRDQGAFVPSTSGERACIYKKGDWKFIRSGSSGTTFFAPLFNRYMNGRRDMLMVITDGQIYDLDVLKPYERTLWLLPQSQPQGFHPPFGTVVYLEEAP